MKNHRYFVFILFFLLNCEDNQPLKFTSSYFDSKKWLQTDIEQILADSSIATKYARLMQNEENQTFSNLDSALLSKEFKLLLAENINKPILQDKYNIDTIFELSDTISKQTYTIHYYLKDAQAKEKIKKMSVSVIDGKASSLHLQLSQKNLLHTFSKEIVYYSKKMIQTKAWEKTLFQDTLFYETKIMFKAKP